MTAKAWPYCCYYLPKEISVTATQLKEYQTQKYWLSGASGMSVTECKLHVPIIHISFGVFKKHFDELQKQCFELDKRIQLQLAVESKQLAETDVNEKIQALRAAQQHCSQARQLYEKANTLQELLNLQCLHSNVTIMPAYTTATLAFQLQH